MTPPRILRKTFRNSLVMRTQNSPIFRNYRYNFEAFHSFIKYIYSYIDELIDRSVHAFTIHTSHWMPMNQTRGGEKPHRELWNDTVTSCYLRTTVHQRRRTGGTGHLQTPHWRTSLTLDWKIEWLSRKTPDLKSSSSNTFLAKDVLWKFFILSPPP